MLRATWEKTSNPILQAFMHFPRVSLFRKVLIQRPTGSQYTRPITTYLFFAPPSTELVDAVDLVLDFPGGGFVAMSPLHHQERLRLWAISTKRPVLSVDYGKAPECEHSAAPEFVLPLISLRRSVSFLYRRSFRPLQGAGGDECVALRRFCQGLTNRFFQTAPSSECQARNSTLS